VGPKTGCSRPENIQPLLDEIARRTRLHRPGEAFTAGSPFALASTQCAGCQSLFSGVFQDGSVKVRIG
jgi:hypothetical protein